MRFIPIGSEFAAEVEGIDLCAPLDAAAVAAIHAGMDRHAVLVFHDQPLTDEQQIAFTRSLGKIELNTANNITRLDQRRLSIVMSAGARSISEIGCGIRILHSRRYPRNTRYCLLASFRPLAGIPSLLICEL